jgi:hypothetical protein
MRSALRYDGAAAAKAARSERALAEATVWLVARRLRAGRPIELREAILPRGFEALGLAPEFARAAAAALRAPLWTRASLARARDEWLFRVEPEARGPGARKAALGPVLERALACSLAAAEGALESLWARARLVCMARAGRAAAAPAISGDVWALVLTWLAAAPELKGPPQQYP